MDKYLLAIIVLIIFSILVILYLKISTKVSENKTLVDSVDPKGLKADEFTILE
jgi:uncharacterized membrane protein YqiK